MDENRQSSGLNQVLIATCTDAFENVAANQLLDRSLLYNRDKKDLNIVLRRHAVPLTRVDSENIIRNEDNEISLSNNISVDTITSKGDEEGIDWKSQTKVCETTNTRTIYLLFKENKSGAYRAFIGGEIIEVGSSVYGHYQISLTSTGSRLLKGASTSNKKARLVLVSYEDEWYYGIKFKSESSAKIYFAGWQNIPDVLAAPVYTEYGDSDMSEVIELDDDSDTGTQVIDYDTVNFEDKTWEFSDPLVTFYAHNKSANFSVAHEEITNDDEAYIEYGDGIRIYPEYITGSQTQQVSSNSTLVQGANCTPWRIAVDYDNATITIGVRNNNTSTSWIRLYPSNADGTPNLNDYIQTTNVSSGSSSNVTIEHVDEGIYWVRQQDTGEAGITYTSIEVAQNSTTDIDNWRNDDSNVGFHFGNGLYLRSRQDSSWINRSNVNNTGVIFVKGPSNTSDPLMSVNVSGSCTVTMGFSASIRGASTQVRATTSLDASSDEWASSVVATSTSNSSITTITFNYEGPLGIAKTIFFINETAPVKIYNVAINYPELSQEEIVEEVISNLEETGEDGTPHTIRLNGTVTKNTILNISDQVRETSNKQFVIDLSNATMESRYVDWCADSDLSKAFMYCIGLRAFYYPKNVTTSGDQTFMHCTFLREVHFNKEMQYLGENDWHGDNFGVFAGCRLKTIFLPASIRGLRGYSFSASNIINVYVEKGTQLPTSIKTSDSWCEWFKVKRNIRFIFASTDYNRFATTNETFGGRAYPNAESLYQQSEADRYLNTGDRIRDHVELWTDYDTLEDPEFNIDYTA